MRPSVIPPQHCLPPRPLRHPRFPRIIDPEASPIVFLLIAFVAGAATVLSMTITLVSAMVALLIGGIEALGLMRDRFSLVGTFWNAIVTLNNSFNGLGLVTVGVFLAAWGLSYLVYRVRKIDEWPRGH
jgi:hypothetical protein